MFNEESRDIYQSTFDLFNVLLHDCSDELTMSSDLKEIRISAPEFIISLLRFRSSMYGIEWNGKFRGIEVIPSHELALSIFHIQFPLYKKDWMIYRILLMPPVVEDKGIYKRYTFNIMKHFGFSDDRSALN